MRIKKNFKRIALTATLCLTVAVLAACNAPAPKVTYSQTRTFALDTLVDLKIYHYDNSPVDDGVLSESVALIGTLENTLSSHIQGTDIDRINQAAGTESVSVSPVTYQVIKDSLVYSQLTDGLFDITAGPLIDLWAIDPPDGHVASPAELAIVLPKIDYNRIDLLEENKVGLADAGMEINLGAIAKGTISDKIKAQMLDAGVTSALINLGGNVLMLGSKPDGSDFSIGVQDPVDDRGAYLLSLSLKDKAVVSSGDYERYFEVDGVRYHHILNPITGFPASTNIAQVTIVADTGEQADGLSTSFLLLGVEKGLAMLDTVGGVEAVLVTKDNNIYITPGLSDAVTIDWDQSNGYTFVEDPALLY